MESWIYRELTDLDVESALSFLLYPIWLGIQHLRISLELDIESNQLRSLIIKGFLSVFILFFNDIKTESESEEMIKYSWLLLEMTSCARSIVRDLTE